MAEHNIKINVKTNSGYDTLYPKTKADIVDFNKSGSNLEATNVDSAIKEVNIKSTSNQTNIGTLPSLMTSAKNTLVSAINEIYKNFIKKTDIINNLSSTSIDKPLSANMGKTLKTEIDKNKTEIQKQGVNAYTGYYASPWSVTTDWKDIGNTSATVFDNEHYKALSANSSAITVKQQGYYLVYANQDVNISGGTTNIYTRIVKNDTSVKTSVRLCNGVGTGEVMVTTYCQAGDTIKCEVSKSSDGTTVTATENSGFLTIVRLD